MSTTPHILANGNLTQDWSNTGLITANDDWSGIGGIVGYLGDIDAGSPTGVDPTTLIGEGLGAVDVIANQTTPNTATAGGVAEFQIADPTIALNGSGTADAPSLVLYLDASSREEVRIEFDARDIDGSADNAIQPIAVQYRLGSAGAWTNAPGGFDGDVTTQSTATETTHFNVLLPAEVNGRADLQVRILTTNAAGNDEWVGIDNINVSSEPADTAVTTVSIGDVSISEGDAGTQVMTFTVTRSDNTSSFDVDYDTADGSANSGSDYVAAQGVVSFTAGGSLTQQISITINGDTDSEPNEAFTVELSNATNGAQIADASATGTVTNDDVTITKISAIQGTGVTNTMNNQIVTVEAIVVGDFQTGDADNARNLNGFYLQEEITDSDGNVSTSEGIFVFGGMTGLNVGDRVRVTGSLTENFGMTQLNANTISVVQAGAVADISTMAAVIDLPTAGVTLNQNGQYQPDLEAYEGMLVTIPETLTVSEQFNLDRFNDIKLVAGDRPAQFTHDNDPDVAGYQQHLQEVGSRTITYDDGLNSQNQPIGNLDGYGPTYNTANAPRMGDTVTGLTGVLDYQWAGASADGSTWRVRAVENGANEFESVNERPETPPDVGGNIQVGSFNVLNYFKTLNTINEATGAPDNPADNTAVGLDPRGANDINEFNRQTEKLVNVLCAMDADILGLIEIENDFLPGSAGNALEYLVNQMNAQLGSAVYSWVNPGQQFVGSDAISVACIYKPSEVRIALDTTIEILSDADLPQELLDRSTVDGVFNGLNTSRNVLTVTFEDLDTGGEFTAAINHFKSKSGAGTGSDADQLDGQGAWQNQRELAAEALTEWLATDPTGSGDDDIMLLGDFNAYFKEDAVGIIEDAGYENLQLRLEDPYSYVFDGQIGSLDYIFANEGLASQVTGVAEWHINADEADALDYNTDFGRDPTIFDADTLARVSDHDPILVGLNLQEEDVPVTFKLQLLHFSDAEAGLLAPQTAKNLAALVDKFEDEYANTLVLSSGDNFLPGPFIAAGTDPSVREAINAATGSTMAAGVNQPIAAADIAILNAIGIEASTIGNHDFDLGSKVLRDAITPGSVAGWNGANFAYLSANLDFSADADLNPRFTNTVGNGATPTAEASTLKGRVAPAAVITEGGQKIGIIGATTQLLESISSPTGTEVKGFPTDGTEVDDMTLLAAQLQPIIDEMIAEGINKIIVQSHLQQIANEQLLATKLRGVDIIIGGGSNTRLADSDDELGSFPGHSPVAEGTYPIVTAGADGKTTLIVNTDGEYTYLGRLTVEFDDNGEIIVGSLNPAESGAYVATAAEVAEAWGVSEAELEATAFANGTRGDKVRDVTDAIQNVINVKDGNVLGKSDVYLEGERAIIRTEETNLGNLTADANLWYGKQVDGTVLVSLKNGGGVRSAIGTVSEPDPVTGEIDKLPPDGGVSQLDIENSLRFNNALSLVTVTAEQLLLVLEHAVRATTATATPGQFAQIGGIAYSFDMDLPPGNRVLSAALIDENGNPTIALVEDGELVANPALPIRMVTLSFLLTGGDSYPLQQFIAANPGFANVVNLTPDLVPDAGQESSFAAEGTEQDAFAEYLKEFYEETAYNDADTDRTGDTRIQNLNFRDDTILDGKTVTGGSKNETLNGDDFANVIDGRGGNDTINGGGGKDLLLGGDGHDKVNGGRGNDALVGGEGDDTLKGDEGRDLLLGGARNDKLEGGSGNDVLIGGSGNDEMTGGEGADIFVFGNSFNRDSITDFNAAEDRIIVLTDAQIATLTADLSDINAVLASFDAITTGIGAGASFKNISGGVEINSSVFGKVLLEDLSIAELRAGGHMVGNQPVGDWYV
ncbi:hypothetical protein IZ6_03540 [Terrihabitans soli]|uniref:Calx-beta domain-containing protein n=1 Tax=Terrihabitans soli TaxID=708113 RepID=A0A6S6QL65_9HYPH|nr:ExeM/NucH family extracellular endonuclease [Terrihabitans soli]BCJ89619.1 hypothetical protein IZ6_03540 [Terrihabitans soli]